LQCSDTNYLAQCQTVRQKPSGMQCVKQLDRNCLAPCQSVRWNRFAPCQAVRQKSFSTKSTTYIQESLFV